MSLVICEKNTRTDVVHPRYESVRADTSGIRTENPNLDTMSGMYRKQDVKYYDFNSDELCIDGGRAKPGHEYYIPDQNDRSVDVWISHQQFRRRPRGSGSGQSVPQQRDGADPGRHQWQLRREHVTDHRRRPVQHQQNLATNNTFQTKTIEALTSGYRINSSGDDPAGLAVANQFRSNVTELTQGVINGNSGVSTLQIIDGGLSNISTMLDRMKTLATESASGTFTGNRSTLDQEFQSLKTEITRQATNIGLISGGANATNLSVYIGGSPLGGSLSSAAVSVDLSAGLVDTGGLGLTNAAVGNGGAGTSLTAAPDVSGNNPITLLPTTFNVYTGATGSAGKTVTLSGIATGTQLVSDINNQLAGTGLTANINSSTGKVEFQGGAFELDHSTGDFAKIIGTGTASNASMYQGAAPGAATASTASQDLTFTVGGTNTTVTLQSGLTVQQEVNAINRQMNAQGVYAVFDSP